MGRRGRNEGSIYRREDGRWVASLVVDAASGRRKYLYGGTRQEVQRKLSAAQHARDAGLPVAADRQTVSQYLASWLETVAPVLKPKTVHNYRLLVQKHLVPELGKIVLAKLTAQQVQQMYARKLASGLSTTSVHHIHAVLHRALERALRLDLVARNVCDLVDAPPVRRTRKVVMTTEQVAAFVEGVRGDRLEAFYILALTTGMRVGELLGLRWSDVDLDRRRLVVSQTVTWIAGQGFVYGTPKTKDSERMVSLALPAVEALARQRAAQLRERVGLGAAWAGVDGSPHADLVFTSTIGGPLDGTHVLCREFHPLLARLELPRMRLHDLRHTAASLALADGVDIKVVSAMLGHSSISITGDLYLHLYEEQKQAAADTLGNIVTGQRRRRSEQAHDG